MDELLELISRIGTDTPPTVEELAAAKAKLKEMLRVAADPETRDLDAARALREAIDKIDAETAARDTKKAADDEEARKLLEGLGEEATSPGDEGGEGDAAEGADAEPAKDPEPVAASGAKATDLRAALRRTGARMSNTPPRNNGGARVILLGPAASEQVPTTLDAVAQVFSNSAGRVFTPGNRQSFVRVEHEYPDNRRLMGLADKHENDRILSALLAPQAIAAAGGICDPLPADFAHPIIGDRGRPITGALPRFNASRGGVRFSPTATLGSTNMVAGATGVWTTTVDESPGETEKAQLRVTCPEEDTATVDAITASLVIGNFQQRFNPELWRSRLDLLMVAHDRRAEQTAFATMDAGSTQVTYGAGNGTIYALLSSLDKAVAGMRSRHRYQGQFRFIGPQWARNALRSDIASQRPGSDPAVAFTIADNIIDTFFSVRGVSPVWSLDLDVFGTQGAGALLDYPGANLEYLLFPEGAWFFLDGGTLDLGTEITDATMTRQNDRMAFMETFEQVVYRGGESLAITVPIAEACICPDVVTVEASS